MKKITLLLILLYSTFAHAQYFQRWFNYDVTAARTNYKPEVFYDGLCSRLNFNAGDPTKYYNVGLGFTKVSEAPVFADTVDVVRFVRTNKDASIVNQNFGFAFAKKNTTDWLNSEGHAICEIDDGAGTGGYIAVGSVGNNSSTNSSVPGGSDALIARISSGASVPNRLRFDFGGGADELNCVIRSQVSPGYFFACGTSTFATYSKVIVMKFSSTGVVSWAKTYHFDRTTPGTYANICTGTGIAEDPATGSLFVVGKYNEAGVANAFDGLLLKLTSGGAVLWVKTYDLGTDEEFKAIKYTASNHFIICGYSNVNAGGGVSWDTWLIKVDNMGVELFSKILEHIDGGVHASSKAYDVTERANGGVAEYYMAGLHVPPLGGQINSITKWTSAGVVEWYGYQPLYPYNEHGFGIDWATSTMTNIGLRLFSGRADIKPTNTYADSYMMRAYFNGATCTDYCPLNVVIPDDHSPEIVSLDTNVVNKYNKYSLDFLKTNYSAAQICTEATIACGSNAKMEDEPGEQEELAMEDFRLYPNPASQAVNIVFQLPEESSVSMFIADMSGRKVKSILSEEKLAAGIHEVSVNGTDLPSAVYQCIMIRNNQAKYIKLVIEH